MLFCAVSANTPLRPDDYDPRHVIDLFVDQATAQLASSVPMPTDPSAREMAMAFLRQLGGPSHATHPDLPAEVHQAFRAEIGMTYKRWCYTTRMQAARELLARGTKPTAVAERLGYSTPSNFSNAFTTFHGFPPRQYQEHETTTS